MSSFIAWAAVVLDCGCSERAAPLPVAPPASAGAAGQAGSPSAGSAGASSAGASGAGTGGVLAPGGASGSGGDGAVSPQCSPDCGGATPICDPATLTCKTCTAFDGCPSEQPRCDAAANGGLGACTSIEVLAIYTEYELNPDLAHRSYVAEANDWFPSVAAANGFSYQSTSDWSTLTGVTPARGRVVVFLDDKPDDALQRAAFEAYMKAGGAWLGCHFAAYNADPSEWDWYFHELLGAGAHDGNTWRPTSAQLRVEDAAHPVTLDLGPVFTAAPNEWYRWKVDLRTRSDIQILLSIDPASFPLGTGPKPEEIWHSGYYPVVWTNTNYRMLYVNMGHDDMDYGGTNQALSSTFSSTAQNQMLLNAVRWLGGGSKSP